MRFVGHIPCSRSQGFMNGCNKINQHPHCIEVFPYHDWTIKRMDDWA